MKKLTWFERKAIGLICKLKANKAGEYYKCRYNDAIMWAAFALLGGRDPIVFCAKLVGDDLGREFDGLK